MKILVILTGGTIACSAEGNVLNVDGVSQYKVIDEYRKANGDDVTFTVLSPINILSENISLNDFKSLVDCLNEQNLCDFDGIIIGHGSDTLPYTCALLDNYFNSIDIPIVLVCSNYSLSDERANGVSNFINAVNLIKSKALCGVFTVYKNRDEKSYIFEGKNLYEADSCFDDFDCFYGALGEVCDGKVSLFRKAVKSEKIVYKKDFSFENLVRCIKVYPGIDLSEFIPSSKTKAILLECYHSATASVCGNSSVLPFITKCNQNGIDVYFCSKKRSDVVYASTDEMIKAGAKPVYLTSPCNAYSSLLLKYNAL